IKKVLVIGSGPIVIGQAAEFDYSGTQACLTLKEAGCEVVLINNNPATIMTDEHVADTVYFEPLTVQNIEEIIKKEKPDGILATVSGQTGLNLIFQLAETNILETYKVEVLGTPIDSIAKGEDRELFRNMMEKLNEPIAKNAIVSDLEAAVTFSEQVGYPIIIRPAYTLGGSGGGIANNEAELMTYVTRGLRASPIEQCLIEESIAGWKEIEFEVVRDRIGNAVTVCHMENIDPVGVHTGDSIVVAPIQTLTEEEVAKLRSASLSIVDELGIIGACNVQLAYNEVDGEYIVIEVNPRVSRSSALASKATGYPIAKIATKLSLGMTLDELHFPKMKETLATYEPKFDYIVVKFPSFPFNKLKEAERNLGTQMKATGEVMAIEKSLAAGIQKAVRSLELEIDGLRLDELIFWEDEALEGLLMNPDDRRFFAVLELFRRGKTIDAVHELSKIDHYFLTEMKTLITLEKEVQSAWTFENVTAEQLLILKQAGFTNTWLSEQWGCSAAALRDRLFAEELMPTYDSVTAYSDDIEVNNAYYYTTWQEGRYEAVAKEKQKVLMVGSGPIQIGQGIEFDYCSVHGVFALQKQAYETVLINNNPATVSTDYELADRLIFEPITSEDVLLIMELEGIEQVIVQFGGQTALNLVKDLEDAGVEFFGTTMDTIDKLEDRDRFYQYLRQIDVPHIPGLIADTEADLLEKVDEIGYPVLIRPSYVIGGRGMEIFDDEASLRTYLDEQVEASSYPLLVDAYYRGKEVEVDVVTDGEDIFIPAIFEHIEKAGVHSGDSMAVTPPISLSDTLKDQIVTYAERIAKGIKFKGIFNIQYVIYKEKLFVLEVNPRASRTVPVICKVTGVNMIEIAAKTLLGESLQKMCGKRKLLDENDFYAVKAPVFSTNKLAGVDPVLVPEMKSTGEVIAMSDNLEASLRKAFLWNDSLAEAFLNNKKQLLAFADEATYEEIKEAVKHVMVDMKDANELPSFTDIEAWMKEKNAYAIYQADGKGDRRIRERALEFDLFVFTATETLKAFTTIPAQASPVKAINEFQLAYEKEVILQ
ncbi:MAG TPA: carbamoyl phosphate synthase large subunit, partial [Pseudogracilibacillus sp.]|nr:carbamoyl phosphate synthase large subunit [Pseudogracilibacillus sp.]